MNRKLPKRNSPQNWLHWEMPLPELNWMMILYHQWLHFLPPSLVRVHHFHDLLKPHQSRWFPTTRQGSPKHESESWGQWHERLRKETNFLQFLESVSQCESPWFAMDDGQGFCWFRSSSAVSWERIPSPVTTSCLRLMPETHSWLDSQGKCFRDERQPEHYIFVVVQVNVVVTKNVYVFQVEGNEREKRGKLSFKGKCRHDHRRRWESDLKHFFFCYFVMRGMFILIWYFCNLLRSYI